MFDEEVGPIKEYIQNAVGKEGAKLCYLATFGSVLYPESFDKDGKGTSDIDFVSVVKEDFLASEFRLPGFSRTSPGYLTLGWAVYRHDNEEFSEWAGKRQVDLIVISLSRFDELIGDIKSEHKERLIEKMSGHNAHLLAFAEGKAFTNNLDYERCLHLETLKSLFSEEVRRLALEHKREARRERE